MLLHTINLTSETINQQQVEQNRLSLSRESTTGETAEKHEQRMQQLATLRKMSNIQVKVSVRCQCANLFSNCVFLPALALYDITASGDDNDVMTEVTRIKQLDLIQLDEHNIDYQSNGIDLYLKTNSQTIINNYGNVEGQTSVLLNHA